jgi:hypothetical protein
MVVGGVVGTMANFAPSLKTILASRLFSKSIKRLFLSAFRASLCPD